MSVESTTKYNTQNTKFGSLPERLAHLRGICPRPPRTPSGFVYVIGCHDFVKIGIAENVIARLAVLQVGCPYKLSIIGFWPSADAIKEEEAIHAHFDNYRVQGEWFKLPKEIMLALTMKPSPETVKSLVSKG